MGEQIKSAMKDKFWWCIMMALFADVPDHLEYRFSYRVDGMSMSVYKEEQMMIAERKAAAK